MIGGEILKTEKNYSIKNIMIYFTLVVFAMSVVLPTFPKNSAANGTLDESDIVNDTPHEVIELIKDTEAEVIYKTLEDGNIYLYEEQIVGDVITTTKSLVDKGTTTLTEKFSTTIKLEGDNISVLQKDLLTNTTIHQKTVSITEPLPTSLYPDDERDIMLPPGSREDINGEYAAMATGKWVNSRTTGQNYAYYKYNHGGGFARELGKQKSISSYTTKFDNFTRNVDAARSFESGILYELTVIGVLDKAFKTVKSPTVANLKSFFKQYLKTIPGIGIIYNVIKYFNICNKTMASYKAISGTPYNWR